MAGTRAWVAWVVGMTILYRSSQMMLTEYPPAPASSTVPLPVLSTPTHLGRVVGCRGQKNLLGNDDVDAVVDAHIDEASLRLPSTDLALRPLAAMHTWGRRRRHRPRRRVGGGSLADGCLRATMASTAARLSILLRPRAPTRCNWTSWFDNTQKRLDRPSPPPPPPACAVHGSVIMPSTRESGRNVGVGGGLARASCAMHCCAHTCVHLGCGCERVGAQGLSEWCARWSGWARPLHQSQM